MNNLDLQEPESKDQAQTNLTRRACLELPDPWHWERKYQDIAKDIECCDGDIRWNSVSAMAFKLRIPVQRERPAHAGTNKNSHEHPAETVNQDKSGCWGYCSAFVQTFMLRG